MIYHETEHGILYNGESLEVLRTLPDNSVNCCVTSPPYWGLRDYGTATWIGGDAECDHKVGRFEYAVNEKQVSNNGSAGHQAKDICPKCGAIRKDKQLGLEKSPEEYVANMVQLFREVRRVLKADGVLWLNLGDSYASNGCYLHTWMDKHPEKKHLHTKNSERYKDVPAFRGGEYSIKPKDLVGIPWRVAFALQADGCTDYKAVQIIEHVRQEIYDNYRGEIMPDKVISVLEKLDKEYREAKGDSWYLRQDIIWHKPNPMPESVRDRCTKSHEYIFMLTKSARYYFDSKAIKENTESVCTRKRASAFRQQNESDSQTITTIGRNKRSVWTVTTKPYKEAHFATYPPDLILPCVKAAKADAVILDPFFGSGTTGLVAVQNGRRYIGIDLNPKYCEIAASRIERELDQTTIDL